jgi:microcin C transport system substrate-binding protein
MRVRILLLLLFVSTTVFAEEHEVKIIEAQSIALHSEPKYPDGFKYFGYVNPDAPKGGLLRSYTVGTFDSFNRYAQRGDPAIQSGELYDTLMVDSDDEISVYYPLIAEKIRYAEDYSFISFIINEKATFSDGKPITANDVAFSFNKFKTQGIPSWGDYVSFVKEVVVEDEHTVTFKLEDAGLDEIMTLVALRVLPEHYWKDRDLSEPLKEVPVGSSGIMVSDFKFGQYVVYESLDNYWAKDLPVNKGQSNFKYYRYDYYRDQTVAFEAFKAGDIDIWQEGIAKQWATGYDLPAIKDGRMIKEEIEHEIPQATQGFIFNTKRPQFSDPKVREALSYAMDFEWMNKNLFFNQYVRTVSYFQGTDYMARDLPSKAELEILEPIRDKVPPEVFSKVYNPPVTDGSGNIRSNLRTAIRLLKEAGWEVKDKKLTNVSTGDEFKFELMTYTPTTERIAIPLQQNLKRLGIEMTIRQVDVSQFLNREHEHDYDMISWSYSANAFPSSGLLQPWHSKYVDSTYNLANVTDEAVDYLLQGILDNQQNSDALLNWGRALDRVLTWNHYLIPQWHANKFRVAYWDQYSRPSVRPKYALGLSTWWYDKDKAIKLK